MHVSAASFTIKVQFHVVSASGRLSNFSSSNLSTHCYALFVLVLLHNGIERDS